MPATNPIADLLFKYLIQSLATEEQQQLDKWLEKDDNKAIFAEINGKDFLFNEFKEYWVIQERAKELNKKIEIMLYGG